MSSISEMTREIEERGLYDKEPNWYSLCKFCGLPFTRQQNGIESFGCGSSYMESCRTQWIRTMECYEIENGKLQERIKRLEEDYHDLIMQVERKFDGETRHETAKRYIRNAEAVKLDSHESKEAKP